MSRRTGIAAGVVAAVMALSAGGQQPAPPIVPAQARLEQTVTGLAGPGFAVAASEQAGMVAAACEQGKVLVWKKDGNKISTDAPKVLEGHKGPVTALAWGASPVLASGGADHKVILWNPAEGKALHTIDAGNPVRSLAMSPDGKTLAVGGDGDAILLVDTAAGKVTNKLIGHKDWVLALAFNPDGKQLASGGYEDNVILWDVSGAKKQLDVQSKAPSKDPKVPAPHNVVWALAFSPDGKTLAIGGSDAQVHLSNVADGKLLRSFPGHTSTITGLAFSPDGKVLVSASKDRSLQLWNPAAVAKPLKGLDGHTAWVQGVIFLGQGTHLASVGADQTLRVWDLTAPAKK